MVISTRMTSDLQRQPLDRGLEGTGRGSSAAAYLIRGS